MAMFSNEAPISSEEVIGELADSLSHLSEQEREQVLEFFGLDWKHSGTHMLPHSNSTISLPEGYSLLIGQEAKKERELSDPGNDNNIEAVVYDESWEHIVFFENINSGYVSIDDWAELNPKDLLNRIRENTEKVNIERRKKGVEELYVVDWIQEPTLDKNTNTVYWAIEAIGEEEGNIVNSVALRLNRHGFERIVWITQKDLYTPFGGHLDVMLRAHTFDPGHRYQDFVKDDRIAEYGIATLVTATLGGKIIKATGLLVIFKKFGAFAFAALAGLFYKIRKLLSKDKKNTPVL